MLYGIPPLRMVMLAKHAAHDFSKTLIHSIAVMASVYDADDPVYRSKEQ